MSPKCSRTSVNDSPLLRNIQTRLERMGKRAAGVRVSITRRGEWFQPQGDESQYWVKWLCWNILSRNGKELTKPEFAVVHGDLSQTALRKHLQAVFPDRECIVDNDITFT